MATKKTTKEKKPRGRPRKNIDPYEIYKLRKIGCTDAEIADHVGVSVDTLIRRKKDDPDFCEAYAKGTADCRISLRRQLMRAQSPAERIFLAKNFLSMTDRQEHTGPDGGPLEIKVVYEGRDA